MASLDYSLDFIQFLNMFKEKINKISASESAKNAAISLMEELMVALTHETMDMRIYNTYFTQIHRWHAAYSGKCFISGISSPQMIQRKSKNVELINLMDLVIPSFNKTMFDMYRFVPRVTTTIASLEKLSPSVHHGRNATRPIPLGVFLKVKLTNTTDSVSGKLYKVA